MPNQTFRFEEPELGDSALQAQILLRCRRSLDHDLKNAVQALHSGIEVMSRTLQAPGSRKISPLECIPLLQQQLANLQAKLGALLDEVAPAEPAPPAAFDLVELLNDLQRFLNHESAMAQADLQLPAQAQVLARKPVIRRVLLACMLDALDSVDAGGSLRFVVTQEALQVALELRVITSHQHAPGLSATRQRLRQILERTLDTEGLSIAFADSADGSLIRMLLPMEPLAASAPAPGESAPRGTKGALRVLVVDDNRDAADSLALLLDLEGHGAKSAYTGEQALSLINEYRPALVLLDIGLPDMAGEVVAQRIRDTAAHPPLLVSISGFDRGLRRNAAAPFEFDAELVKPVELAALRTLLESLTG